ncbi:MAG: MoaD/ThiS family protein [Anaerolineales bacterium]|nr:MoaD/ThiS family protein [Anaerolineales bacterium]
MITVHVKLFAALRYQFPGLGIGESMPVEIPEGWSVSKLIEFLKLSTGQIKVVFVNNKIQRLDLELRDGDRIGIFPPVGGG